MINLKLEKLQKMNNKTSFEMMNLENNMKSINKTNF